MAEAAPGTDVMQNLAQGLAQMQQAYQAQLAQFAAQLTSQWLAQNAVALPPVPQIATETVQALQQQYLKDYAAIVQQGWKDNTAQELHALGARLLTQLSEAVQADDKTRARIRFGVEQWIAASAPGNYLAFNLEAQKKAIETNGQSIALGLHNLLKDIGQGQMSLSDERQFEVGRNLATSEGAVVFENELFQLIEYKALTEQVYERPLLMVPPCINKFYILDLQPGNSLVRHVREQGHRVFMVSWRNPDESLANKTWDDYVEQAVIKAIAVVQTISGQNQINALGFCVGGTLLGTALAVLPARGEKPAASVTFLTTFLSFVDTGVLDVFIDESAVRLREQQYAQGGLMSGKDLAATFSFLRPNELVWNYVAGNYLKGETPPPFDLLYWNGDSTNLPGPWYAWYLRNAYLENNLIRPGHLTVCGEKLDLRRIDIPAYIYGSKEDHIVPVTSAYASTQVLSGPKRFVMGASGHIAGVINPPEKKKRSYWTREDISPEGLFPSTVGEWRTGATEQPGSWWPDWLAWLAPQAGKKVAAPTKYGRGAKYKEIEPAPGRYVKAKA
jgi:polyhydroxyalkanoate synthase